MPEEEVPKDYTVCLTAEWETGEPKGSCSKRANCSIYIRAVSTETLTEQLIGCTAILGRKSTNETLNLYPSFFFNLKFFHPKNLKNVLTTVTTKCKSYLKVRKPLRGWKTNKVNHWAKALRKTQVKLRPPHSPSTYCDDKECITLSLWLMWLVSFCYCPWLLTSVVLFCHYQRDIHLSCFPFGNNPFLQQTL